MFICFFLREELGFQELIVSAHDLDEFRSLSAIKAGSGVKNGPRRLSNYCPISDQYFMKKFIAL